LKDIICIELLSQTITGGRSYQAEVFIDIKNSISLTLDNGFSCKILERRDHFHHYLILFKHKGKNIGGIFIYDIEDFIISILIDAVSQKKEQRPWGSSTYQAKTKKENSCLNLIKDFNDNSLKFTTHNGKLQIKINESNIDKFVLWIYDNLSLKQYWHYRNGSYWNKREKLIKYLGYNHLLIEKFLKHNKKRYFQKK
jgi:hypothetical protein